MKSVIMAGGMGTRLKPLTCLKPKPLVPFMGKPMIDHVLNHLEENGIKEHIITLFHLPQTIIDHVSVQDRIVDFTVEREPRGTAGSVKEAAGFLRSSFVVASGDSITDIDLKKAIAFHRKKGAIATIVLTRVAEPLEYGVVLTNADGKVTRFLEKPTWGEVFSDTVNTGMYILEPEVLSYIPAGRSYDFSKDLFPALLKAGLPLLGYIAEGYWSDVGSIMQYRESHFDVLNKKVQGINAYIDEEAKIDPAALVVQPVSILKGAKIGAKAKIGPYAVVGEGAVIGEDSEISHSIVGGKAYLGPRVIAEGSIIDERAYIGEGSRLLESTIVAEETQIGERSILTPRVKVYPGKTVGPMSVVNTDLIHGSIERGQLFTQKGLRGKLHRDLTVDILIKTGVAFAEVLGASVIASACSGDDKAEFVQKVLSLGVNSKGADVVDFGEQVVPSFRLEVTNSETDGAFYVFSEGEYVTVRFFDAKGCYIDANKERKIENLVKSGDGLNPDLEPGKVYYNPSQFISYLSHYQDFVVPKDTVCDSPAGRSLLEELGPKEHLGLRAQISASGEYCRIWDEKGHELTQAELEAASVYLSLKHTPKTIKVPLGSTSALEEIASELGGHIQRIRPGLCYTDESSLPWHDAFRFITLFCRNKDEPLYKIVEELPKKTQIVRELNCPLENRSGAMLRFASQYGENSKNEAGLYFRDDNSFLYLQPDEHKPLLHLTVEGSSMEVAEELVSKIQEMIQ
ncbi:MAG: sugar phosphate nucleotidyltransferase [Firmicutes bacterium]|nr:sugar phosphate nucleotidyltransferase [Bacillota bacterium]